MKKLLAILPVLFLVGCQTPPERIALNVTNAQVVLVDSAMLGWAVYVRAGGSTPEQIKEVRRAYEIYYAAALVEKAAWLSYVNNAADKTDIQLAQQVLNDVRKPLLDLLMQVAIMRSKEVAEVRPVVTPEDVEWAFSSLRIYEDYGIK